MSRPSAKPSQSVVQSFAGTPGNSETFDALHELLEVQAYRLASWRVAPDDINYRRFFDVNDLAGPAGRESDGIREHPSTAVRAGRRGQDRWTAGRSSRWIARPRAILPPAAEPCGRAAGRLRVAARRIRRRYPPRRMEDPPDFGVAGQKRNLPIYLVAEKITASFEHIPPDLAGAW